MGSEMCIRDRHIARQQQKRLTKTRRRKYARHAAWSDDLGGEDFRMTPRYVPRAPRPLCQDCREPSTGSCASCHRFLCDNCVVVCDQGCEWHDKDLCILCLGGHPCTPVPADGASEAQGGEDPLAPRRFMDRSLASLAGTDLPARGDALTHVLLFAACFWASSTALPHPGLTALAAALAYTVAWVVHARAETQTHFEHCRAWTLLAVCCVTLGKSLWVTALCAAWVSVCPAWMLWWPKESLSLIHI